MFRMKTVSILVAFLVVTSWGAFYPRRAYAWSEENFGPALTTVTVLLYTPSITIPINAYMGATHQGSIWWGVAGIGGGLVQTAFSGVFLRSEGRRNKWIGGTLLAAGLLDIGAGIYAIVNRKPKTVSFSPGLVSEGAIKPGLTFAGEF